MLICLFFSFHSKHSHADEMWMREIVLAICIKNGKKKILSRLQINTAPSGYSMKVSAVVQSIWSLSVWTVGVNMSIWRNHTLTIIVHIGFCTLPECVSMAWLVCLWLSNMMMNHHLSVLPGAPDLHQPEWLWLDTMAIRRIATE